MTRRLWAMLAWSPAHGAATTIVGVIGLQQVGENSRMSAAVEWIPLEEEHARIWRSRLATTPLDQLSGRLDHWERSATAMAIPLSNIEADSDEDLPTAVAIQVDQVLASPPVLPGG